MAAIGAIRKHGVLLMVIIGVALLAFILGDFSKVTTFFSNKYTMGKIDNERIDKEYQKVYEQNTALFRLFYEKSSLEESETYQVHAMTWDQILEEKVLDKELKKLGMVYTDEMVENVAAEILASLRTQQPDQLLARLFQMLATSYGAENAYSILSNIESYKDQEGAKEFYDAYKAIEHFAVMERKKQSYYLLAQASLYFSDPLAKQFAADNKSAQVELALINPGNQAFNDIAATVSDKEMKDFYKAHKSRFENKIDSRDIDVAIFPILPTQEDLKTIEDTVRAAYARFVAAPSIAHFNVNEMLGQVDSTYYTAEDITLDVLDTLIFQRPVGSMIEPFTYQDIVWYFGKVYGAAMRPDSLQIAYMVVDYKNSQNPTGTRTKKAARREADSLKNLLKANPNSTFEILPKYMAGRNASDTTLWIEEKNTYRNLYDSLLVLRDGGVYVNDAGGAFIVYQVLQRTQLKEKRQFAIYPYEIKASDATVKSIRNEASNLAASATSDKELVENANQKGIQLVNGFNVTSMAANVGQLGNCRDIVSWAFNDETKVDNISDVYNLNNQVFAVASLKAIHEKGIAKFKDVKTDIEAELTAEKKINMIEEKLKADVATGKNMSDIAMKYGSEARDSVTLAFGMEFYQNSNVENNAIGKIFTLPADNKINVVSGKQSLYLVSVHNYQDGTPTPNLYMEKAGLRNIVLGRSRNENVLLQGLKDKMPTLDRRHHFYVK